MGEEEDAGDGVTMQYLSCTINDHFFILFKRGGRKWGSAQQEGSIMDLVRQWLKMMYRRFRIRNGSGSFPARDW